MTRELQKEYQHGKEIRHGKWNDKGMATREMARSIEW